MEVSEAFSLISRAIDTGHPANGYLLVGDIKEQCNVLVDMILEKLFPNEISQIRNGSHPDIAYLEPEGAKRIIKVESMRERIVEPMSLASFSGGWKVGVIIAADRMEAPSANAFLKSLEEPTPKTMYLLLTDQPDSILPTIISRSQRVDLPLSEGLLEGEAYELVAEAFAKKDVEALTNVLASIKEDFEDADAIIARKQFFKTIMSFARKMMIDDKLPRYQAFRNIEAIEDAYRQVSNSINEEAVLSFMLDRIALPNS